MRLQVRSMSDIHGGDNQQPHPTPVHEAAPPAWWKTKCNAVLTRERPPGPSSGRGRALNGDQRRQLPTAQQQVSALIG